MALRYPTFLRRTAVFMLTLTFVFSMTLPAVSLARVIVVPHDGTEGDPGDGVLKPEPNPGPRPHIVDRDLVLFRVVFLPDPDGKPTPVFFLEYDRFNHQWVIEGRLRHAP